MHFAPPQKKEDASVCNKLPQDITSATSLPKRQLKTRLFDIAYNC